MSEAAIVDIIRERFGELVAEEAYGLRDDTAALPPVPRRHTRVVSTDMLVEREDFAIGLGPIGSAGHRAIVQNLSDLAAAGAAPVAMTWSLAIPQRWLDKDAALLRGFVDGAAKQCERWGVRLLGGDLSSTRGPMVCSVTVFGDVKGAPMTRAGAQPGDRIYLSWWLGASAAGLKVLRNRKKTARDRSKLESQAVLRHLWPIPEITLGNALVGKATACIDVTDGLLRDLDRICRASGVAAEVRDDCLLASTDPAAGKGKTGRKRALTGGEDYALLFTAPRDWRPKKAHWLGDVIEGEGMELVDFDGNRTRLDVDGWDHFDRKRA
jgi:thiamine-monophosphate kinase